MAKILIVDDMATNRRLLVAILEQEGHQVFEAVDGVDGLSVARVEHPDLVISDILMPSMDGYEFVRQLRAQPELSNIPVIFYTAHYHEREARRLAQRCQVACVLVKPCSAEEILTAVRAALASTAALPAVIVTSQFDREHLGLMTNKLSQQTDKLRAANSRLAALNALNVQLASERDASVLLERVCQEARNLLGASYAVLAVRDMKTDQTVFFSTRGPECQRQFCSASNSPVRSAWQGGQRAAIMASRGKRRTNRRHRVAGRVSACLRGSGGPIVVAFPYLRLAVSGRQSGCRGIRRRGRTSALRSGSPGRPDI